MYTIVVYVTFFVFIGVVVVLQTQLLPQLLTAAGEAAGPLSQLASQSLTLDDHRTFFYTATLVQAMGSGAMAGMVSRGKAQPGMLHAAVMALTGVLTFPVIL